MFPPSYFINTIPFMKYEGGNIKTCVCFPANSAGSYMPSKETWTERCSWRYGKLKMVKMLAWPGQSTELNSTEHFRSNCESIRMILKTLWNWREFGKRRWFKKATLLVNYMTKPDVFQYFLKEEKVQNRNIDLQISVLCYIPRVP